MIIAVKPSPVQFVAVRSMSGMPLDMAIQMATNSDAIFSGRLSTEAKKVALQSAVPIPAGRPGAAIVNRTIAGQAMSKLVIPI